MSRKLVLVARPRLSRVLRTTAETPRSSIDFGTSSCLANVRYRSFVAGSYSCRKATLGAESSSFAGGSNRLSRVAGIAESPSPLFWSSKARGVLSRSPSFCSRGLS